MVRRKSSLNLSPGAFGFNGSGGGSGSVPAPVTAYANPGGMGDRVTTVPVTSNFVPGAGLLSNLVNGVFDTNAATGSVDFGGGTSSVNNGYIRFDFGVSRYVNEMKVYNSPAVDNGVWLVQGSADGATWVTCGTFAWTATVNTVVLAPPITGYRYYRLYKAGTPTVISTVPYYQEVEFKISA